MDRNAEIWSELNQIELNFAELKRMPVLKMEGETDGLIKKWQPVKGISNIISANSAMKKTPAVKR